MNLQQRNPSTCVTSAVEPATSFQISRIRYLQTLRGTYNSFIDRLDALEYSEAVEYIQWLEHEMENGKHACDWLDKLGYTAE